MPKSRAQIRQELIEKREWVSARSIWGCANWAYFYFLIGAREAGKSYDVMDFCLNRYKKKHAPFYWLRLNEASTKKMLQNSAAKMVDADLVRKYHLNLSVKGDDVYDGDNKLATVLALSTAYNSKGVAEFDKDWDKGYTIVLDEFQLEKGQKRTFDVVYNLVVQLENLVRSVKKDVKIIFIGNSTEEASDVLSIFNFIPEKFGIFKLKAKKCVIVNMKPTEAYLKRRKGTVGDILAGHTSNYTNQIYTDMSLIYKGRLKCPSFIIKFTKDKHDWYTCWDGNIIAPYHGEKKSSFSMKRYIDDQFLPEQRDRIYELYDTRVFKFRNLITQKRFGYDLSLIKRQ